MISTIPRPSTYPRAKLNIGKTFPSSSSLRKSTTQSQHSTSFPASLYSFSFVFTLLSFDEANANGQSLSFVLCVPNRDNHIPHHTTAPRPPHSKLAISSTTRHHIPAMAPIHQKYLPVDTTPQSTLLSSLLVLRASDQRTFVAAHTPSTLTLDAAHNRDSNEAETETPPTTPLAPILISTAATSLSRILNHPNIVSLVDIVSNTALPGSQVVAAPKTFGEVETPHDFTVWEDMNAGCLSLILPSPNSLPDFDDGPAWHALASPNYQRFSLPEELCWHVFRSIGRALLWLHWGVKETVGIEGDWQRHDDDWQPILIRDVSPGQVWLKQPSPREMEDGVAYGECKLGGFHWAKVTGCPGAQAAMCAPKEDASVEKQYYWAPEVYKNEQAWSRASEVWSLGAVVYTMMTGMPPPRYYEYNWQISRMSDKGFSRGLKQLVAGCLVHDVSERPDALRLVMEVEEGYREWESKRILV